MKSVLRIAVVGALALAAFGVAHSATAAPDNKNTESFPVTCAGLGTFTVSTVGDNSATAFGPDGQVFVAKQISGTATLTFDIEGGPTIGPIVEPFEEGAQGGGFEGRLIECSFTGET